MAEWSKALVLGTNHICGVGSNPTAANFFLSFFRSLVSPIYSSFQRQRSEQIESITFRFGKYAFIWFLQVNSLPFHLFEILLFKVNFMTCLSTSI